MAIIDKEDVPEKFDVALVDSDTFKYTAGFAVERTLYHLYDQDNNFVDTFTSAKDCKDHLQEIEEFLMVDVSGYKRESEKIIGDEDEALKALDVIVDNVKRHVKADKYRFYLSGKNNFRDKVATLRKYGGNRDEVVKPVWLDSIVNRLRNHYQAISVEGLEGDDQVGVGLTALTRRGKKAIHIGLDKDVKMGVEGWHYDFKKDEFSYVTPEEALRFKYCQGISGDLVDGFAGIPKVGLKKAEKILEGCETEQEMYEAAVQAYRDYYGGSYSYTSWDGKEMTKTPEELFFENMTLGWIMIEKDKVYEVPKGG